MSQDERPEAGLSHAVPRRQLLERGLAMSAAWGAVGLLGAGCTPSDPRIAGGGPASSGPGSPPSSPRTPGTSAPPPSEPQPSQSQAQPRAGQRGEQALADLAAAILAGPHRADLSSSARTTLAAIRDGHRAHLAALRDPRPATRPPASPATAGRPPTRFGFQSLAGSLRLLAADERRQAARLRPAALRAVGNEALLLGSISVAADGYADAVSGSRPVRAPSSQVAAALPAMSDVAALQSVVRQLHALIYGYQVALGQLSLYGSPGKRALAGLAARRRLRDRLVQNLVRRSATVPAAAPAYVPPVTLSSEAKSRALIRRMEVAFQPFCGVWLASAARTEDRQVALDALTDTAEITRSWGARPGAWPGWRD